MLINFNRFSFLGNPLALVRYKMGDKRDLHDLMMLRAGKILLGNSFNKSEAKVVLDELRASEFIPMNTAPNVQLPGNRPTYFFGKFLYFIIRLSKPEVMVETGVAHGVSSWTILNAMHRNGKGKLYSIDLPNKDLKSYNPENIAKSSGWVVPDVLRQRWELQLGSSKELLPALMSRLGNIDVFFHDSDHSYENMHFEFKTVLPHVRKNGLIISDDVHKNKSFPEFVTSNPLTGICFFTKGGAAVVQQGNR
jgi:predicted O-methyltransferase YrrM